ncbi:hypothetical protein ABTX61_31920 [Amycolatopsis japonica]|uniref:hypothetical protein n=1 Tax=Amycolatopsis japonica TaxID=208439 RepID=UPI00332EA42D
MLVGVIHVIEAGTRVIGGGTRVFRRQSREFRRETREFRDCDLGLGLDHLILSAQRIAAALATVSRKPL